ncbi:MAG: response regulator transcription factor [Verrucomicrobiales bacterium]|nr:response regulator transcription factor [Verrucomicrobiales bacterium]
MGNNDVQILVVDDHSIVREGIAFLLRPEEGLHVCGLAANSAEAMEAIETYQPQLVVTDLSLPDKNGLELIRDALALYPDLQFLVISMHDEALYAERVLRAGGKGYIMKEAASEELVDAIRQVISGEIYISRQIASLLLRRLSRNQNPKDGKKNSVLRALSDREIQVFELIGRALSNQAIAKRLNISIRTVDAHKSHIKEKLDLPDNNALLRFAVKWLDLEQAPLK